MALFKGEKPSLGPVKNVAVPAATGQISPNGVTLTAGDILLFMFADTANAQRVVVVASGNTLAVR